MHQSVFPKDLAWVLTLFLQYKSQGTLKQSATTRTLRCSTMGVPTTTETLYIYTDWTKASNRQSKTWKPHWFFPACVADIEPRDRKPMGQSTFRQWSLQIYIIINAVHEEKIDRSKHFHGQNWWGTHSTTSCWTLCFNLGSTEVQKSRLDLTLPLWPGWFWLSPCLVNCLI